MIKERLINGYRHDLQLIVSMLHALRYFDGDTRNWLHAQTRSVRSNHVCRRLQPVNNVREAISLLEGTRSISGKESPGKGIHAIPLPHKNPLHAGITRVSGGSTTHPSSRTRRSSISAAASLQHHSHSRLPAPPQQQQQDQGEVATGQLVAKAPGAADCREKRPVSKRQLQQLCREMLAAGPRLASADSSRAALMHVMLCSLLNESALIGRPDCLPLADVCAAFRVRCDRHSLPLFELMFP
jgi:hypothetical protein